MVARHRAAVNAVIAAGVKDVAELLDEQTQGKLWLQELAHVAINALECTLQDFGVHEGAELTAVLEALQKKLDLELAAIRFCTLQHSESDRTALNEQGLLRIAEMSPRFPELSGMRPPVDSSRSKWSRSGRARHQCKYPQSSHAHRKLAHILEIEARLSVAEQKAQDMSMELSRQEQTIGALQDSNSTLKKQRAEQEQVWRVEKCTQLLIVVFCA